MSQNVSQGVKSNGHAACYSVLTKVESIQHCLRRISQPVKQHAKEQKRRKSGGQQESILWMTSKITPATAPCCDLGKQLIPFEFIVGYMTDTNRPERGNKKTAESIPPIMLPAKHTRMAKLIRVQPFQFAKEAHRHN